MNVSIDSKVENKNGSSSFMVRFKSDIIMITVSMPLILISLNSVFKSDSVLSYETELVMMQDVIWKYIWAELTRSEIAVFFLSLDQLAYQVYIGQRQSFTHCK